MPPLLNAHGAIQTKPVIVQLALSGIWFKHQTNLKHLNSYHYKYLTMLVYVLQGSSSNGTDTKDSGEKTSSQFTGILANNMSASSGSLPPISST
jgi:hypothetical protein